MYRLGPIESSGRSLFSKNHPAAADFTAGHISKIRTGNINGETSPRIAKQMNKSAPT
jgi:hypothetical protein